MKAYIVILLLSQQAIIVYVFHPLMKNKINKILLYTANTNLATILNVLYSKEKWSTMRNKHK